MRYFRPIAMLLVLSLAFSACQDDTADKIAALETYYAEAGAKSTADSLLLLYQAAVKAHPDRLADNLHYLTKAARIEFDLNKKHVEAVRLLNDALEQYGKDQDLAEPIGMLARVWRKYKFKATPDLSRNPDDIDLMQANLEKNAVWIDSALIRMDRAMRKPNANIDSIAGPFIETAEGYALLVEKANLNKHVDLLMKAAGLAKTAGDPNTALRLYYNVAEKLPDHPKAPTALFLMGFIYENDLKNLAKAKEQYELFLERYPDDPDYADDAKNALKYLGMSPEEMIQQFEQNPQ